MHDKLMTPEEFVTSLVFCEHSRDCECSIDREWLIRKLTQYTAAIRQAALEEAAMMIDTLADAEYETAFMDCAMGDLIRNLKPQPAEKGE